MRDTRSQEHAPGCTTEVGCRLRPSLQGVEKSVVARHEVGHALVATGEPAGASLCMCALCMCFAAAWMS